MRWSNSARHRGRVGRRKGEIGEREADQLRDGGVDGVRDVVSAGRAVVRSCSSAASVRTFTSRISSSRSSTAL